ncbi:MAG: ATP-binding protein [Byssovorax sp.]
MKKLKLLLVDDDAVDRRAVRRALAAAKLPVEITEAVDADAAFAAVAEHGFDCILLDLRLPGRDGLDVLRTLAADGVDVPVVILTGHGDEDTAVEIMKAGAADYIAKALLTPQRLEQSVRHAVRVHQAEREAREARRAREEFLAIVAHDLRTPLGVVVLSSNALREALPEGPDGEEARALNAMVERAASQMGRLIRDLLDASSIEAGRLRFDIQEHDAAALLADAADLLAPLAQQKSITMKRPHVSAVRKVRCDRDRILQVLSNLIGNAIKFTPDGGAITLRIADAPSAITFTVADNGPGVPEGAVSRIFERHWSGRGKAGADTGLGLYIAKGIVEAHDGQISLAPETGGGTAFSFTLPRDPSRIAARD